MADDFWRYLELLVSGSTLHIDRPRGSHHPRYPELVYPLDYGYLDGTTAADGSGIDIWIGTQPDRSLTGIVTTVDLVKRDAEIKILLGCTKEEIQTILSFHNASKNMQALFIQKQKG
jgi:inorganic pyrophosphatase